MVNQSVFLVECSNFWNVNCASALPHSSASVCFRSVSVCVFLFIFYARISKILKSTGSKNNNFSGLVFKLFNGILMWYFGNHLCKSLTKPNDFFFWYIFTPFKIKMLCVAHELGYATPFKGLPSTENRMISFGFTFLSHFFYRRWQ